MFLPSDCVVTFWDLSCSARLRKKERVNEVYTSKSCSFCRTQWSWETNNTFNLQPWDSVVVVVSWVPSTVYLTSCNHIWQYKVIIQIFFYFTVLQHFKFVECWKKKLKSSWDNTPRLQSVKLSIFQSGGFEFPSKNCNFKCSSWQVNTSLASLGVV